MNIFYRISNAVVGAAFAGAMGFAIYKHAPELWGGANEACVGVSAIVALVGILVVGFLTLDARKV